MNRLSALIEYALLGKDYVVIPGLGTFSALSEPARREEDEEIFLPPFRSVRFSNAEKQDDETAIDALRTLLSTTRDDAEGQLREWVEEARQKLNVEGSLELGIVGKLVKQSSRAGSKLRFEARSGGITDPVNFGLDMIHIPQLETERKARIVPMTASMEMGEKEITIRINRRIANFVAAACAAILLFVVFNTPLPNGGKEVKSSLRELIMSGTHKEMTSKAKPAEVKQQPKQKAETKVAAPEPKQEESSIQPTETGETTSRETNLLSTEKVGEYCIVMASAISLKNAEHYVEKLSKQGFLSARIVDNGKVRRVVVGHYSTEEEAHNGARSIRHRSEEFSNVWVHYI